MHRIRESDPNRTRVDSNYINISEMGSDFHKKIFKTKKIWGKKVKIGKILTTSASVDYV